MNLYRSEDRKILTELVEKAAKTGESFEIELTRDKPTNEEIIFLARGLARKNESGDITHLYGTVLDITDRKKQERELSFQHRKLKAVLENTTDAFFEVDNDFKVIEINEKALTALDCKREEVDGRILWDVFPKAVDTVFFEEYNRAISENIAIEFEAYYEPLKMWFEVHGYPNKFGLSVYFRDISKRKNDDQILKNALIEAKSATRAKSEFLANMSHEIRTPLNGILGNLQLLNYTELDEEQLQFLEHTEIASNGLMAIIEDILDLSRIESGNLRIENKPLQFSQLKESLHAVFDQQVANKNLEFLINIHANVPHAIKGDISRLRQVLVNLIGNSVKFTNTGSIRLEIELLRSLENNQFEIAMSVIDTGVGIPEDLLPVIFEPFTQGQGNTSKTPGTGLGLSIVKRLIEMMGGEIQIKNVPEGGACIETKYVFEGFENQESEKKLKNVDSKKVSLQTKRKLKILVAEDDHVNQAVFKKMLTLFGHEFLMVNNGNEALEALKNEDFDLILMDMQMPVLNGMETTKVIRSDNLYSEKSDIPIIALTAHAMEDHRDQALGIGMNDFLTKPVMINSFKELLDKYA